VEGRYFNRENEQPNKHWFVNDLGVYKVRKPQNVLTVN